MYCIDNIAIAFMFNGGSSCSSTILDGIKGSILVLTNPQTTVRGPLDPAQHSDRCTSETERMFNVKEIAGFNGPQWSRKWELFFWVV